LVRYGYKIVQVKILLLTRKCFMDNKNSYQKCFDLEVQVEVKNVGMQT
jgi:hypothetical protein